MNTTPFRRIIAGLILAATLVSTPAADLVWTNVAGGNWSNTNNWSPNQVPANGDSVFITNSGSYIVTFSTTASLASLTVGDTNSTGVQRFSNLSGALTVTNITSAANGVILISGATMTISGTAELIGEVNQASGTLQLNTPVNLNQFNMTNGVLSGANCFITNFNWIGGTFYSTALGTNITVPAGGTLNISSANAKTMTTVGGGTARVLINNGTATWSGARIDGYYGPAIINNATMTITSDTDYVWQGFGNKPVFINNATLNLATGSDVGLNNIIFQNAPGAGIYFNTGSITFTTCTGTNAGLLDLDASSFVNFDSGSFRLDGAINSPAGDRLRVRGMAVELVTTNIATPSMLITAGSLNQKTNVAVNTMNQSGGTWQLSTPISINNYNLTNGTLSGADCVITNFNWLGGSLTADAFGTNTTIPAGGTLTISGASAKTLNGPPGGTGRVLLNHGLATWSGANIDCYYGPQLVNSGTMTIASDVLYVWQGFGIKPAFINNSTLILSSGSDLTLNNVTFNNGPAAGIYFNAAALTFTTCTGTNAGLLDLDASSFVNFDVSGSLRLDGAINSPAGDHLRVRGMAVELVTTNISTPSLLMISGSLNQKTNVVINTLNQGGGTWQLSTPVSINNYNLTNGTLSGADCVITNFNWLGGTLTADAFGTNTTIPAGGTLAIASANAKGMTGPPSGTGRVFIHNGTGTWSGASIEGFYGPAFINAGSLTMTNDSGFTWGALGGKPVFRNAATFIKSGGTGIANFSNTIITNSGDFTIASGGLANAAANFTQTAGNANLGTNFSIGTNVRIEAGTFAGRGNVGGTFYNNGLASAGSPLGLITGAAWTNSAAGTIRFEIGGTNPGTNYDQFRLGGAAAVNGTADLALANGFVPVPGNTFTSIICSARSGTFANLTFSGGYEFSVIYTPTTVVFRAENALPTVSLTTVGTNVQYVCNPFQLLATASDVGGTITNLSIWQDATVLATSASSPVTTTFESDFPAPVTFVAKAVDDQGGISYATQTVSLVTAPLEVLMLGGVRSNTTFKICMAGLDGTNYTMLANTNLLTTNWVNLGLMEHTNGIWRFHDANTITNLPRRYYRTVRQ